MSSHNSSQNKDPVEIEAKHNIMKHAQRLFAAHGYEGTSIRDIAKEAQVNLSMISYYFGGKEGLYKAIITDFAMMGKDIMEKIFSKYDEDEPSKKNIQELMMAIIDVIIEQRIINPEIFIILDREKFNQLQYSKEIYEGVFTLMGEKICSILMKGKRQGFVRKNLNPHFFVLILMDSIHAYFAAMSCDTVFIQKCCDVMTDKKAVKEQFYNLFLEGIFV